MLRFDVRMKRCALILAALMLASPVIDCLAPTPPKAAFAKAKRRGRKGSVPGEKISYERAIEIEDALHIKRLRDIHWAYRFHPRIKRDEIRRENERHEKRVEEIKKEYGVL